MLLGATGDTGKPLLRQILAKEHYVTAIVRGVNISLVRGDPSRITSSHENLTLVKGDIYNPKSLAPIFKGHDVIISVLEFPKQAEK